MKINATEIRVGNKILEYKEDLWEVMLSLKRWGLCPSWQDEKSCAYKHEIK